MTKQASSFLPPPVWQTYPQSGNQELVQRNSSLRTMDLEEGRRKEVWAALFWSLWTPSHIPASKTAETSGSKASQYLKSCSQTPFLFTNLCVHATLNSCQLFLNIHVISYPHLTEAAPYRRLAKLMNVKNMEKVKRQSCHPRTKQQILFNQSVVGSRASRDHSNMIPSVSIRLLVQLIFLSYLPVLLLSERSYKINPDIPEIPC